MHQNFLCGIVRTAMLCLLVSASLTLTSRPTFAQQTATPAPAVAKAVMRDGHAALECTSVVSLFPRAFQAERVESKTWSIELTELDDKPAFKIPVNDDRKSSTVFVSANRVALVSYKSQNSFDESRTAVTWKCVQEPIELSLNKFSRQKGLGGLELKNAHYRQYFYARVREEQEHSMESRCCHMYNFPVCASLVETAFTDFLAAEKRFAQITKSLPPMREAEWREFQPKAAAWRALPIKPPISDDVNKHWLLAEDELKEKHFDAALREYEAALEIEPLWPLGQFDAAMLDGELKNYDDAVWHMRCYLELTPNAPDAQAAHDQMLLWQARAEQ